MVQNGLLTSEAGLFSGLAQAFGRWGEINIYTTDGYHLQDFLVDPSTYATVEEKQGTEYKYLGISNTRYTVKPILATGE